MADDDVDDVDDVANVGNHPGPLIVRLLESEKRLLGTPMIDPRELRVH
jgi:hypothetical protein